MVYVNLRNVTLFDRRRGSVAAQQNFIEIYVRYIGPCGGPWNGKVEGATSLMNRIHVSADFIDGRP